MKFFILLLLTPLWIFGEYKILVLGDSNSYGVPKREYSWVSILKKEFKDRPEVVFFNYALGMSTAAQCDMLHILATEFHQPSIVIYAGGLVDVLFKKNLDDMRNAMQITIQRCFQQKQIIIFGLIDFLPWINLSMHSLEYLQDANKVFLDVSQIPSVIPFIFLDAELLTNSDYNLGDTVHPNIEGQKIIARRIKIILDNIFKEIDLKN